MSNDNNSKLVNLLLNSKNIGTGILVIISLIGALYGSFKTETDARETYKVLAPDVDLALEMVDHNNVAIAEMQTKLGILQAEKRILENLLVGFLISEGKYSSHNTKQKHQRSNIKQDDTAPKLEEPEIARDSIVPIREPEPLPQFDSQDIEQKMVPIKRRERPEPYWKK